jgi:hypothetical protein
MPSPYRPIRSTLRPPSRSRSVPVSVRRHRHRRREARPSPSLPRWDRCITLQSGERRKMGLRKSTGCGSKCSRREWVDYALSTMKSKAYIVSHVVLIVCTSTRRGCYRNHRTEARRRFPSRYRRRPARPVGTVCIRGSEQEDETEIRRKSCGSASRL